MQYLFDLLYLLPALIYAPVFFVKSRRADESPALLFSERWGCIAPVKLARLQGKHILWIHAVSVGEVMVARSFIGALRQAQLRESAEQKYHCVLTTVTPTGQKLARQAEAHDLTAIYVPFDFSFCVQSFLKAVKPEALVLVETEIWPNLILLSKQSKLPILMINARLSEKSLCGYRRVLFLFKTILSGISKVFAQDDADAERFSQLGIPKDQIETLGNIKFDAADAQASDVAFSRKNFALSDSDQVWIAGSTHPGEEKKVLELFLRLREKHPNLKLILAPRHIERADGIVREIAETKLSFRRWGEINASLPWDILVVDQLGVLKNIYALGNFVFMGGSWIEHGGQNPIEPAVYDLPILHGPHVFNFKQVYEILDSAGAAFCVEDQEMSFQKIEFFLNHPEKASQCGRLAGETVRKYRGASTRQAKRVMESLKQRKSAI